MHSYVVFLQQLDLATCCNGLCSNFLFQRSSFRIIMASQNGKCLSNQNLRNTKSLSNLLVHQSLGKRLLSRNGCLKQPHSKAFQLCSCCHTSNLDWAVILCYAMSHWRIHLHCNLLYRGQTFVQLLKLCHETVHGLQGRR